MSVESPEALVLSTQMEQELAGKTVQAHELRDYQSLQRSGFVHRDIAAYARLVAGTIVSTVSRGNTVLTALDNDFHMIVGAEYGGVVLYHKDTTTIPARYHLKLDFADGTLLTIRLTGMGCIHALPKGALTESYTIQRDFQGKADPLRDEDFTFERFSTDLEAQNRMLKPVLLGKDAIVVGLGNVAFQEIAFKAGLHPKRKASSLSPVEVQALYEALNAVLKERVRLNGKTDFIDLYGQPGRYQPIMGSHMLGQPCPQCGTPIEKLAVGGGPSFICPSCQPLP
jgi:formamidopyrimidine-DNA glycosylase